MKIILNFVINYHNLDAYLQGEVLKLKIKDHKSAGQYECQADNGIDEMQSKIIIVNVNGMSIYMNFALKNLNYFWYKMWS